MKSKRGQRGATIAEVAVTAVVLFTLILGTVDFGRAYSIYQTLTDAAREGARFAVAPDATTEALPSVAEVQAHVTPFLSSNNINTSTATVALTATSHVINGVTVTYTQVTVTAPYTFLFFPFGAVNMTSNSEMRNETN